MAFQVVPKLCVSHSCCDKEIFVLRDGTNPYDATLNPNGWALEGSADNIEIPDVQSSGLTITSPSGTAYGPYSLLGLGLTTASFVVPAVGSTVTISLSDSSPYYTAWMYVGMPIRIIGAGAYTVVSFTSTSAVVRNSGTPNGYYIPNIAPGGTITTGKFLGIDILPSISANSLRVDIEDILGTGDAASYEDGYWKFDWTVQGVYGGSDTPFHARCLKQKLVLCDVECCVDNLVADSDPSCGCSKTASKKSLNAFLTLAAIKANDAKKNRERAKARLADLQGICNNNCTNC